MSLKKQSSLRTFFQSSGETLSTTEAGTASAIHTDSIVGNVERPVTCETANGADKRKINSDASDNATIKKKSKTYKFREDWKCDKDASRNRDWLYYDEKESLMYCSICQKYDKSGKSNSFRTGCKSLRLQEIKIHEATDIHKRSEGSELAEICARNNSSLLPMEQSVMKIHSQQTNTLKVLFQVAYWMAKNEKPYKDFPKILELMTVLGVDTGHSYATDKKAREFIVSINEAIMNDTITELNSAEFFSVLCDGTTDCSTTEQEIIYIRYVHDGSPKTVFVCISSVTKADASHIFQAITDMFHSRLQYKDPDDWKTRLVGTCFDGAYVMMGCRTGVATKLKHFAQHIVSIHCCAHRLELAVKDTSKSISYMSTMDELLYDVYAFYKYSANRWEGLQAAAEALSVNLLRPVRVTGVRWLPHHMRAVKAVHQSYSALSTHLENEARSGNKDNQERSRIILKTLQSIKFVMFINFYLVFLNMLAKLSKVFQSNVAGLHTVHEAVDATSAGLDKMSDREGLKEIMLEGVTVNNEQRGQADYSFRGYDLSVPERATSRSNNKRRPETEVESAVSDAHKVVQQMKENLAKRFDVEDEVCGASYVLNPERWPESPDSLNTYGDDEIKILFHHFERPLTSKGYTLENTLFQWTSIKKQILRILKVEGSLDFMSVWQRIARSNDKKGDHKDMLALIRIVLALPVNSAVCERGFSLMKRVKSDWRSRLKSDSLTDLMSIQVNGTSVREFLPDAAVALWMTKSKRYQRHPYGIRASKGERAEETQELDAEMAWDSDETDDELQ